MTTDRFIRLLTASFGCNCLLVAGLIAAMYFVSDFGWPLRHYVLAHLAS